MTDWSSILDAAVRKREPMGFSADAAYRVFDGDADGAYGVYIDVFAGRWLVQTLGAALPHGLTEALAARGVSWWWKRLDQEEKESPVPQATCGEPDPFLVAENDLRFEISFKAGYSQGLFLDQRLNRARVKELAKPGQRILNLFAYTAGFSVAAASAGAVTTTVDLSQPYLDWSKRNFAHNGIDPAAQYFIKGDAMEWLGVFAKKNRLFDGVVLDPPTFSRVKGRGVWRAQTDYHQLVAAAARVLTPDGWLFCSANCRGMSHDDFEDQVLEGLHSARVPRRVERGRMPPDFTGDDYLLNVWCLP